MQGTLRRRTVEELGRVRIINSEQCYHKDHGISWSGRGNADKDASQRDLSGSLHAQESPILP